MNTRIENINKILPIDEDRFKNLFLNIFKNNSELVNIELTVLDYNNNVINNIRLNLLTELNKKTIIIENTKLSINPGLHLRNLGYTTGKFNVIYKFFVDEFGSHIISENFLIKTISSSRYELRAVLLNDKVSTTVLQNFIENKSTKQLDRYINFDNNLNYLLLNIIKDNKSNDNLYRLKILDELDTNISEYSSFWISRKILDDYTDSVILFSDTKQLSGSLNVLKSPNIQNSNIGNMNSSTDYSTFNLLTEATNSLDKNKIISFYLSSSLSTGYSELNIDYRDYNNFIHFSSAANRLEKFKYKLNKIEYYNNQLLQLNLITSASNLYEVSNSIQLNQKNKFELINNFDNYEEFMYYESGSYESSSLGIFPDFTWPKYNDTKPYLLYSVTSSEAQTWYNNQTISASLYDRQNQDNLINTIPILMVSDNKNSEYIKFINMLSHNVDIIYNYIDNITDIFSVENSIYNGTPKNLINDLLYNFGMNLVSGYKDNNLEDFLINSGSNIDFSITGSHI